MKYHWEIEQKTIEWFAIRWGKIGGTRSKGLFVQSDTLLINLLAEHVEEFDEDMDEGYASAAMERGNELEPQALGALSQYTGFEFLPIGWIQSDNPLLGISPDGITEDCTKQAEIKCPQAVAHLRMVLTGEIPAEYINQCVHAFTVNPKLESLFFCSYRPENELKPMFVKELTRDSLVDIGWTKKGKVIEDRGYGEKEYVAKGPDLRSVSDWSKKAIEEAEFLQVKIASHIEKLKF